MDKKEAAVTFLELATAGRVREAYEQYVHPDFSHHNPFFSGDRESLLAGMEESAREFPDKEFEHIRALEDGDLVAVHGKVRLASGSSWIALVHIFRFAGDQIIEEWEVAQEVPQDSPNEHGMV